MNSITKLIFSISALIAPLSFAWLVLTATGIIPAANGLMIPQTDRVVGENKGADRESMKVTRTCPQLLGGS